MISRTFFRDEALRVLACIAISAMVLWLIGLFTHQEGRCSLLLIGLTVITLPMVGIRIGHRRYATGEAVTLEVSAYSDFSLDTVDAFYNGGIYLLCALLIGELFAIRYPGLAYAWLLAFALAGIAFVYFGMRHDSDLRDVREKLAARRYGMFIV